MITTYHIPCGLEVGRKEEENEEAEEEEEEAEEEKEEDKEEMCVWWSCL